MLSGEKCCISKTRVFCHCHDGSCVAVTLLQKVKSSVHCQPRGNSMVPLERTSVLVPVSNLHLETEHSDRSERDGVAVFGWCSVRISSVTPAIQTEGFRSFPQSLQANAGIVTRLGHYRFITNPLQLSICLPTTHLHLVPSSRMVELYLHSP
jgi:hypothetical protein